MYSAASAPSTAPFLGDLQGRLEDDVDRMRSVLPLVRRGIYESLQLMRIEAVNASDDVAAQWANRVLGACALADGRPDDAARYFAAASAALGRPIPEEVDALLQCDDLAPAGTRLRAMAADSQRRGDPAFHTQVCVLRARHQLALGNLGQAAADATEALRRADADSPLAAVGAASVLAEVALLEGRVADAARALDGVAGLPSTARQLLQREVQRAEILLSRRAPGSVAAHLRDAVLPAALAAGRVEPDAVVAAVRLALRIDASDVAAGLSATVTAAAAPGVGSGWCAAELTGLLANDPTQLAAVAETLATSDRPLRRAAVLSDLGSALQAAGRPAEGVAALEAAWDIYAQAGASAPARRLQRALRAVGVRRHRWITAVERPTTGWAAVTDGERRVVELVAAGHTNREAAEFLTLSPFTVASHLRSVYTKLGVSSRVQLTRMEMDRAAREAMTNVPAG